MKDDAECFTNGGQFESFVLFRSHLPRNLFMHLT